MSSRSSQAKFSRRLTLMLAALKSASQIGMSPLGVGRRQERKMAKFGENGCAQIIRLEVVPRQKLFVPAQLFWCAIKESFRKWLH